MVHPTRVPIGRIRLYTVRGHRISHRLRIVDLWPYAIHLISMGALRFRVGLKNRRKVRGKDVVRGKIR